MAHFKDDGRVPCNCHPETCCCGGWDYKPTKSKTPEELKTEDEKNVQRYKESLKDTKSNREALDFWHSEGG